MRNIIIITAYCDTEDKRLVLKDCILQFKDKPFDILLHSHYPVEPEIQELCNYCLYDFSNPILNLDEHNKGIVHWHRSVTLKRMLSSLRDDYGFAVMQQWIRSFKFIEKMNYDNFCFINYDVFIDDKILEQIETSDFDGVFYYFDDLRFFELNTCLFFGKFNFIKELIYSIGFDDYINSKNKMLEQYLMLKIDLFANNFKIRKVTFEEYGGISGTDNSTGIKNKISWKGPFEYLKFDNFKIFGGINEVNRFEFIVYDLSTDVEIELEVDDLENHFVKTSTYAIINTAIEKDKLSEIIHNDLLHIKINEYEIHKDVFQIFLKSLIRTDERI